MPNQQSYINQSVINFFHFLYQYFMPDESHLKRHMHFGTSPENHYNHKTKTFKKNHRRGF